MRPLPSLLQGIQYGMGMMMACKSFWDIPQQAGRGAAPLPLLSAHGLWQ